MHHSVRAAAYRLATVFAVVGQLALTLAVSAEGWCGSSAVSHAESRGVDQHYAHNEATCVTCTVLSLHVRGVAAYSPMRALVPLPADVPAAPPTVMLVQNDTPSNPPRAPPQLG